METLVFVTRSRLPGRRADHSGWGLSRLSVNSGLGGGPQKRAYWVPRDLSRREDVWRDSNTGACRGDLLRKLQKGLQASLGHEVMEGGERKREMLRGQRWNSISVSTSSRNLGRSSRTGAPALSLSRWGLGEVASRLWSLPPPL